MAKLTAWLVTLVGVLLLLGLIFPSAFGGWANWVIALAVLIVGIGKLKRNYPKKTAKKRK